MKIQNIRFKHNRLRWIAALCILTIAIVTFAKLPLPQIFGYDGSGGNQGGANGGDCSLSSDYAYFDTCYGAVWRWYPLNYGGWFNSATDTVTIPGSGNVAGGSVSGCQGHKVTGYYRLGLAKHLGSGRTSYVTSSGDGSSQAGLIQVKQIWNPNNTHPGGNGNWSLVNYISNTSTYEGDLSWDEVQKEFERITKNDGGKVEGPNGQKLGWSDVSIFCGNPPGGDDDPKPVQQSGTFWSKSSIEIAEQGDVSQHKETSPKDGSVSVKFSTNLSSVNVTFNHHLYYGKNLYEINDKNQEKIGEDTPATFKAATTKYRVLQQGQVVQARTDFSTGGSSSKSGDKVKGSTVTINLTPGQTKEVCQEIKYTNKKITMVGTPILNDKNEVTSYEFSQGKSSEDDGSSACVEITRPKDPTENPPAGYPGPNITGDTNGEIVFAGEDGGLEWNAKAESYLTRRYAAHQAIDYVVNPSIDWANGITSGSNNYRGNDVCAYYASPGSSKHGSNCEYYINESVSNSGSNFTTPANVGKKVNIVVPETIGEKYCNSLGYKYEYWYGVEKFSGNDDEGDDVTAKWVHEDKDYWTIFNATCRTIAKKPSTAIWNSSIFTVGSVTASLSPRHDNTALHASLTGNNTTTYGSWSEYLDVVYGNVKGAASGSTLSGGSQTKDLLPNSPLTISNESADKVGNSGVQPNEALKTRLNGYLKNQANSISDPNEIAASIGPDDGTKIYTLSGNHTIKQNITYQDGTYNNIYSLPQNIIFVDGDLKIDSNVTRIDAWLIVTGTLDTCAGFDKTTPSKNNDNSEICSNQLAINGPVIANSLALHRSFGSEPNAADTGSPAFSSTTTSRSAPAEIFNLRQDTLLWAYAQANKYGSSYSESYSRELAPRY